MAPRRSLDCVDECDGFALRRHEYVRATGRLAESEQLHRDGVQSVKLVQQPTVEVLVPECLLHPLDSVVGAEKSGTHVVLFLVV
jgi:hypothetical protein